MASSAQIRYQVEGALARRYPGALRPQAKTVRPVRSTGVSEVDALLDGGLPVGAISELTGAACSGRVTLAMAFVAALTGDGQVCAWVDAADGFDPGSAASNGVEMDRLLWVRCGGAVSASHTVPATDGAGTSYSVNKALAPASGCGGMHPRTESQGLAAALGDWLVVAPVRERVGEGGKPGTPGASNRPLSVAASGKVQVPTDRVPARRGEHALEQKSRMEAGGTGAIAAAENGLLTGQAEEYARVAPRCAETQQRLKRAEVMGLAVMQSGTISGVQVSSVPQCATDKASRAFGAKTKSQWDRMDQVIQTTDLLLQGSGFSCVVMDLSGIDARFAHRIPLATWFRFRAAADRTRTSLLVLTQHPCTGSSGEVMLRLSAGVPGGTSVMTGIPIGIEVVRQRFTKLPEDGMTSLPSNMLSIKKPVARATEGVWFASAPSSHIVTGKA